MLTKEEALALVAKGQELTKEAREYGAMSESLHKAAAIYPPDIMEALGFKVGAVVQLVKLPSLRAVVTRGMVGGSAYVMAHKFNESGSIGRADSAQHRITPLHSGDWQVTGEVVSETKLKAHARPPRRYR